MDNARLGRPACEGTYMFKLCPLIASDRTQALVHGGGKNRFHRGSHAQLKPKPKDPARASSDAHDQSGFQRGLPVGARWLN